MSAKSKNTDQTVDTHCPECDKDTLHAVVAAGNGGGGGVSRVKCRECGHAHAYEAPEEAAAELEEEGDDAEEEAFDEPEAEEEELAPSAEEPGVEGDLLEPEDKAEEEAPAEEEDDDPGVAHLRSRLADDTEEPEREEEESEDEEEEDPDASFSDEDARGLSSFGRSSFDEGGEPAEEDAEAPKKKKRRVAPKRKASPARASVAHQSWEEALAEADEKKARSYSLRDTYRPEEIIRHAKFGMGKVVEVVNPNKINVLFKDGRKMMLQGQR